MEARHALVIDQRPQADATIAATGCRHIAIDRHAAAHEAYVYATQKQASERTLRELGF